jgi:glutamate dehydrogenase
VSFSALEARITKLTQRWEDDCTDALLRAHGEGPGLALAHRFANAFSAAYREDFSPQAGAEDANILAALSAASPLAVKLYRPLDSDAGMLRFKIYNTSKVALSDSLPVLERMGARVLDEHPYRIGDNGNSLWIHDLGLQLPPDTDIATVKARFESLFAQAWAGDVESDNLNRLVLVSNLDARAIAVLRAYTRYFKQLGFAFSQSYIEATKAATSRKRLQGFSWRVLIRLPRAIAKQHSKNCSSKLKPTWALSPAWTKTASCVSLWPPSWLRCAPTCGK